MLSWKLIIEDDVGETVEVPLRQEITTIGRKDGNMIKLTERNVSREHALLINAEGDLFVEDLKSYTGVKINGERISGKVRIQEGDLIEIGDYHLALQMDESEKTTKAMSPSMPGVQSLAANRHFADEPNGQDDFAGETERWVPADNIPPLGASLPTVQEGVPLEQNAEAPAESYEESGLPTVAEASPVSSGNLGQGGETDEAVLTSIDSNDAEPISDGTDQEQVSASAHQNGASVPSESPDAKQGFSQPVETQRFSQPHFEELPIEHPEDASKAQNMDSAAAAAQLTPSDAEMTEVEPIASEPPGLVRKEDANEPLAAPAESAAQANDASAGQASSAEGQNIAPAHTASPQDQAEVNSEGRSAAGADPGTDMTQSHRLLAINSSLAGEVYQLTRPEMVLGRIDENDVVLDHRSVSRNHAKVIIEDDIARILDLQSANGIFLNGSEVEQAVLRSGDVIELGRVQIRYLVPGEVYSLSPYEIKCAHDADSVTDAKHTATLSEFPVPSMDSKAKQPLIVWLLVAIVVLLSALLIVVALSSGSSAGNAATKTPVSKPLVETPEEQKAVALLEEGKYAEAEAVLKPLLSTKDDGTRKRIETLLARIQSQANGQGELSGLRAAYDKELYRDVLDLGTKLPADLAATKEAKELIAKARQEGLMESYEQGIIALQEGELEDASSALNSMQFFGKTHERTSELKNKIADAKAASSIISSRSKDKKASSLDKRKISKKKVSRSAKSDRVKSTRENSKKTPSDQDKQLAKGLLKKAKSLMFQADWRAALKQLIKAKRYDSGEAEIYKRLGSVYTALKRPSKAIANYKKFLQLKPYDRSRERIRAQIKELEKEL
jgi:pSer/pThr/pTyr-binding forkhead associated (FHA) protein/tetratricopeptide (TPR) repeat protein